MLRWRECHKPKRSSTWYCSCPGVKDCYNPYTNRQVAHASNEEGDEVKKTLAEGFKDRIDQDSNDVMDNLAIGDD